MFRTFDKHSQERSGTQYLDGKVKKIWRIFKGTASLEVILSKLVEVTWRKSGEEGTWMGMTFQGNLEGSEFNKNWLWLGINSSWRYSFKKRERKARWRRIIFVVLFSLHPGSNRKFYTPNPKYNFYIE